MLLTVGLGAARTGFPPSIVGELRFVQWQVAVGAVHVFVPGSWPGGC